MSGELDRELMKQIMEMNRIGQDNQTELNSILREMKTEIHAQRLDIKSVELKQERFTDILESTQAYMTKLTDRLEKMETRISDNEKAIMKGTFFDTIMSNMWKIVCTAAGGTLIVWILSQWGITK